MSSSTRQVNEASNASNRSHPPSGIRVRSLRARGCPPGPAAGSGLERRIATRRPGRLVVTALVLVIVACFAALVGEALSRLLLLSVPAHLAPKEVLVNTDIPADPSTRELAELADDPDDRAVPRDRRHEIHTHSRGPIIEAFLEGKLDAPAR